MHSQPRFSCKVGLRLQYRGKLYRCQWKNGHFCDYRLSGGDISL